jgi:purine-binding chemotaxis protein CheW
MTNALPDSLAAFSVNGHPFALDVMKVEKVVPAVEIAPLPGAPKGVRGVIDLRGTIIPVYDLRTKFGWPDAPVRTSDLFIIAHTASRTVALIADAALGVVRAADAHWMSADTIMPGIEGIDGVVKLGDNIVFIHELESFLATGEEDQLAAALRK